MLIFLEKNFWNPPLYPSIYFYMQLVSSDQSKMYASSTGGPTLISSIADLLFLHFLKKQNKARQILLCIWKMKKKSKTVFFFKSKNLKSRYVSTRILRVSPNSPKIYNFSPHKTHDGKLQNHINKFWCTIQSYRAFNSLHSSHACSLMMWGELL